MLVIHFFHNTNPLERDLVSVTSRHPELSEDDLKISFKNTSSH
jgi:hypothetical protein